MRNRTWVGVFGVALLGAGCVTASEADLGPQDPSPTDDALGCAVDADCELAASSCCECPRFALPVTDGWSASCEDAVCETPATCAALTAACDEGVCVARCAPVACDITCAGGFERDEAECLVCACGPAAPSSQCADDGDCARVPADCCGCARGGSDTAVPVDEAAGFVEALDCPADVSCPDVDVCDAEQVPRCVGGLCALVPDAPTDGPPGADAGVGTGEGPALCGTPELGACPAGQVCVLNDPSANDATVAGVGICGDVP